MNIKKAKRIGLILAANFLLLFSSITVNAESFYLNTNKVKINVGETFDIDSSIDDQDIEWTSSKTAVASVNDDGLVTGKKSGTAKITASNGTDKKNCTVNVLSTSTKLSKNSVTMYTGSTIKLKATTKGVEKNITWTTTDDAIASVQNGCVTANSDGTVNIEATANGKTATCTVTVKDPTLLLNASALTMSTKGKGSKASLKDSRDGSYCPTFFVVKSRR